MKDYSTQIETDARLKSIQEKLASDLAARADQGAQFDPMLIIMLISIAVQIIIHCREQRADEVVRQSIKNIKTLPLRRLWRLRREVRRAAMQSKMFSKATADVAYLSVVDVGDQLTDNEIDGLFMLAAAEN